MTGYSLVMEFLSMLPRHPHSVPLRSLCCDCGLKCQADARKVVSELKRLWGVAEIRHLKHGRTLCIMPSGWLESRAAADEYMRLMYGRTA